MPFALRTLHLLPVSSLYLALGAVLLVALSLNVSRVRGKHDVWLGDGGVRELQRAARAHGNTGETLPLALLVLLAAELMGAKPGLLHGFGATLLVARGLYTHGMLTQSRTQLVGAVATSLVTLALAVTLLVLALD